MQPGPGSILLLQQVAAAAASRLGCCVALKRCFPAGQLQRRSEAAADQFVSSAAGDQRDAAGQTADGAAQSGTHTHTHTCLAQQPGAALVAAAQIQGGGAEAAERLPVLPHACNDGHASRQSSGAAAQPGNAALSTSAGSQAGHAPLLSSFRSDTRTVGKARRPGACLPLCPTPPRPASPGR